VIHSEHFFIRSFLEHLIFFYLPEKIKKIFSIVWSHWCESCNPTIQPRSVSNKTRPADQAAQRDLQRIQL
jgi:hypothetical protein